MCEPVSPGPHDVVDNSADSERRREPVAVSRVVHGDDVEACQCGPHVLGAVPKDGNHGPRLRGKRGLGNVPHQRPAVESREELGLDLKVSVNLAMENVLDTRLPDDVAALLAKTQLPPRRLVLEITENVVMADPARTIDVLGRLRALGVGLSLDDFGTGQSSLAYLRQLELDELKIDRSFVTDLDPQNAAIVRSTIELAHGVGLRVVAEGVEDADTLFELKEMGADVAQGFYLSRPVPPMEIVALLMHAAQREQPREDAIGDESPGVSA